MDKSHRKSTRHKTLGLMSFISDGKSSVMGIVEDLSESGIRVAQVPNDFDSKTEKCKAVIHAPTGDFTIILKPIWIRETNQGMYKTIGFQIQNPPEGWSSFVEQVEAGTGELGFLILGSDQDDGDAG